MKTMLNLLLPLFVSIFISACSDPVPVNKYDISALSKKDSLALADSLFAHLKREIYSGEAYKIKKDVWICGDGFIEIRNTPTIKFKDASHYRIGMNDSTTSLISAVLKYYTTNREQNDPSSNYPLYSRISLKEIDEQIHIAKEDLKMAENAPEVMEDIIDFRQSVVKEWEKKRTALITLGIIQLPEIHGQFHFRLDYPENLDSTPIIDSLLTAYYLLRDEVCQEYLGIRYLELFYRWKDAGEESDQNKMDALAVLYPIRILDLPYMKKNGIYTGHSIPPPPPPFKEMLPPEPEIIEIEDLEEIIPEIEAIPDTIP